MSGPQIVNDDWEHDLATALDRMVAEDVPALGSILARYAPPEESTDAVSAERCEAFLAKATHIGLIVQPDRLSLRELLGASLLLPEYVAAALNAVANVAGRLALGYRQGVAAPSAELVVYATQLLNPAGRLMPSAALRGSTLAPVRAYEAGPISLFLTTHREMRGGASPSLEGLVAREGAEPSMLAGSRVGLVQVGRVARNAEIDQLGTFSFETVASGTYRLELQLADRLVIVENLELNI